MEELKIRQMLFELAEPAMRVLPEEAGCDEGQLRELWQQGWGRACTESDGDLVKLADEACEELKMLIVSVLMEAEGNEAEQLEYEERTIPVTRDEKAFFEHVEEMEAMGATIRSAILKSDPDLPNGCIA